MSLLDLKVYEDVTVADVLVVIVVVVFATIIAKIATLNLRRVLADKMKRDQLELLTKIVYWSIIIIALLSVAPLLGLNLSGLLVAGGIAGIVIGFASQSVVANLVSGIFLMIERPVKLGDQVEVGGVSGFIEDINIMSTIVRTYDGLYVRIPNEKVFTSNIVNYTGNVARRFEYKIGIRYNDDADKAVEIIKEVVENHPFVLKYPKPDVFVEDLGDNAVIISVRMWAPATEWFAVKMELLYKIKKELEKNGIEIPFPQRVVWFANELGLKR
ncbi:MscS Mechanosensitive ion channel [Ferroglobus placidus DSM 10642]|uniref:MscS Mechanosensitive ion channel n=1 Tax=Ferroglobus placidus (strain DSM 10642 / AEDII12DO) TaxID=589924 RepID=D3S0L3_FERPA|nr:mechanosensitive ion channel family protein [Ferroglobus placidus]ADC66254.1 MscS Mechanosensitive ion channel [Ferroglobus placidus DSM 10642]